MSARAVTLSPMAKRAYGTGSLYMKDGDWYGRWRTPDGRRQAKKIGPARTHANRRGLTKKEAESQFREVLLAVNIGAAARAGHDPTVSELGDLLLANLGAAGRKPSHVESARYHLKAHIVPLLGAMPASQMLEGDVRRLVDRMAREGKAPKTMAARRVADWVRSRCSRHDSGSGIDHGVVLDFRCLQTLRSPVLTGDSPDRPFDRRGIMCVHEKRARDAGTSGLMAPKG